MSEREDYAELDAPPPWVLRFLVRRVLPVAIAILLIVGIVLACSVTSSDRNYSIHVSIMDAEKLAWLCYVYSQRSPDGRFPVGLIDLRSPPSGSNRLLDNPGDDLLDGWGKPFRYAVVANEAGKLEPYVWTERTVDGKTTLLGAKITADGSVIRFGLPADD